MRTIKLSIIGLLSIASLLLATNRFPGFTTIGQSAEATLDAPTSVSASDNAYITKIEISWDAIHGATLYRIFRNTTSDSTTASSIGTTVEATFFDTNATVGQTFFYWVRAENVCPTRSEEHTSE